MIDLTQYNDIRYNDFHIYIPGKVHNFSRNLEQFPGIPNSFWFEDFLADHSDFIHRNLSKWYYSVYISVAYLLAILALKKFMEKREPMKLKGALIGWNGVLAVFSIVGTIRCMPEFIHVLVQHGLQHSYAQSTYYHVSRTFFPVSQK